MDTYSSEISPLWDLSQASSFSQLPDDDFLALLQKQFPSNPGAFTADFSMNGVNPQTISRYSLPSLTPPSEDSSPSPPQQSGSKSPEDEHDLKRKASDDDLEEGPSQKAQHTLSNGKKGASTRRKSSGNTNANPDETRLMKRKEQNRAAQRAFRERKEKHVKDLEDKVAALEAKNDAANSENENLRDLLSRLQNENVMLKESTFTFSVPKSGVSAAGSIYSSIRSPPAASLPAASPPPSTVNPLDWSSLTTFDPGMLSLLDDTPQQTATDGAMQMDFGFGESSRVPAKSYTTIASNPMFTSFASAFDSQPSTYSSPQPRPTESSSSSSAGASPFNFDISSLSAWSTPNPDNGAFDDLFGGFMGGNPVDFNDFNVLMANSPSSSISPVTHHASLNNMANRSPANSTTSSSSSHTTDPLFNTPRESSSSDMDDEEKECPKTKEEARSRIANSGASPFASEAPSVRKAESIFGPTVMCEGSAFPQTQQSEKNMEILTAWRTVTSDPKFKDSDLADLCSEFSSKARCDGTKVVLEPQGVRNIIESLGQKYNRK